MKALNDISPHAHWLLRIALLSVFLFHGWSKLTGLGGFAEMMELPVFIALLVALAETGGGILVFVGGFTKDLITRLGALALVPVMLGAIFMVHWGQWHFMATDTHPMGGMQFQVTLLFMALYLLIKWNNVNTGAVES